MERGQGGCVYANCQKQASVKHPREQFVIKLKVHEVTHDHYKLDNHHDH
jgi:hypothetical protein